jgi:hypothetical protein
MVVSMVASGARWNMSPKSRTDRRSRLSSRPLLLRHRSSRIQDNVGWWQSGCQRAVDELVARGEISGPVAGVPASLRTEG